MSTKHSGILHYLQDQFTSLCLEAGDSNENFALVCVIRWLAKSTIFIGHGWDTLWSMFIPGTKRLQFIWNMEISSQFPKGLVIWMSLSHAFWRSILGMYLNYHASISSGLGFKRTGERRKPVHVDQEDRLSWNLWFYVQCSSLIFWML